ncbi:hypothetical protein [Kitasatospora sp. KL5]|uniref:hypothetical protein n=1 Tax=Kitasatospora sp. KL5 TaxID=3425125 RepID=UPI003D6E8D59
MAAAPAVEGRPAAATGTAATAAATATGTGGEPAAPGAGEDGPRRISRPMIAAAAVAGVVLVGLPPLFSRLGGDGPRPASAGPAPAGYTQQDGNEGFVPDVDAHGNVGGPAPAAGNAPQPVPGDAGTAGGAPGLAANGAPEPVGHGGAPAGSGGAAVQPHAQPQPPQQPQPSAPAQPPAPPAPPAKAAPPTYRAVAGPFCTGGHTTTQQYGWFDDGQAGWRTNTGGHAADGCNGKYTSVPMSGAPDKDDGNSVVWTFNTAPVTTGTCRLWVYVPNSTDLKAVGGAPTYYTVQRKSAPGVGTIGSFTVNQTGNRGRWVSVGSYPLSDGKIAVMLHNRGQDWKGGTKTYAHHAASAVKADCTG